jgi:23S rRNA G2069 N7-methylase RlmK/C1962 C5-methylase RlmI
VNLSDYVDTGLFLDHRALRLHVARRCEGKRFLNLFAYTGSFTVYAAPVEPVRRSPSTSPTRTSTGRGATSRSARSLDRNTSFAEVTSLREIDVLRGENRRFDVIVLDPPSFSNSKNMEGTFDVQRDHVGLVTRCLDLLEPGGELFFSTNKRRFQFGRQELLEIAEERFGGKGRGRSGSRGNPRDQRNSRAANEALDIRKITRLTMPEDFEGTNIHQVWSILRKR